MSWSIDAVPSIRLLNVAIFGKSQAQGTIFVIKFLQLNEESEHFECKHASQYAPITIKEGSSGLTEMLHDYIIRTHGR